MSGKRIRGGKPPMAQKRHRAESEPREQDTVHKKTAIELAMEEADEYERQKETEQRRLQQLKLLSTHRTLNLQHSQLRSALGQSSKAYRRDEQSDDEQSDASPVPSNTGRPNMLGIAGEEEVCVPTEEPEDVVSSDEDPPLSSGAIGKLRLPRSLLEKWVEEPFFEKAVIGCYVRLGIGKAPGPHGEAQYKVCEIIGVEEYKHSYPFGEFETKKALMLRIGRNQRLWRMNVISNHRFAAAEIDEWRNVMLAERQKIPSSSEIDKRKAHMRKAVFSSDSVVPPQPTSLERKRGTLLPNESGGVYSESDVSRLVNARRKRNEAAPRGVTTISSYFKLPK